MKKMMKFLPVVAVMALMAACGGGTKNYENLVAQKWVLEKVETADSTARIEVPANVTIEFSDSSRVAGRGGCNGFFGPYTVEKNNLTFGDLASTMMFCLQMPFETSYFGWLKQVATFTATENTLELKDADGTFTLYYTVFDPTALEAGDFDQEVNTDEAQTAAPDSIVGDPRVAAPVAIEPQTAE